VSTWRVCGVSLAIVVLALGLRGPASAQAPSPPVQAAVDAAPLFRDLLTRFYEAYSRKDLPAIETLWHPRGPARYARNIVEMEFELRTTTLVKVAVTQASIDPGGGRARAIIDLSVVDAKTKRVRRERRVREVTFLQDEGAWKIWNDGAGSVGLQIASRLLAASPGERKSLIETDPEVRSDDTLASLGIQVNRLRSQGKFGEVLDGLSVRAALARALGDEPVLASSLLDIGLVYQVTGRQEEAGRAFAEARNLFVKVGTKTEVAVVDGNLGSVDYLRGDYAAAADRFRRALEVYEAEKDAPRTASALHSLGNALYMQGDFEPAMTCYQRSLAIHEASNNKYAASSVLQAIALVHKETGSYTAAIDAYARSAVLSGAASDEVGTARAEHGLGDTYRMVGDYTRALQHFTASLASWEKTLDAVNRASTMYAVGQVHALQHDFARAVDWYQRALELDQGGGERAGMARDLGGLGGAHFGQGRLQQALDEYRKSLALREQLKDVPGVMWTVVHIGVLQTALAQHSEALQAYERALSIAEPTGDAGAVCTILALRAANELVRDDAEAALASAAKAAEMAQRLEMFDALAHAKVTAGKALRKAGRIGEAIAALEEAVAALERVPVGPGVETFFDDRRSPYLALVDLLASEKTAPASRLPDAFRWWERARNRALATILGGDGAVVVKGLTPAERDEERRLSRSSRALAVRVKRERSRAKPDPDRIAGAVRDLERAQEERSAFRRTLFEAHPQLPVLRAQAESAGVDAIDHVLAPSEALVSFVVLEQRTHALVVSDEGPPRGRTAHVVTIEVNAAELGAQVTAFRDAIVRRDPQSPKAGRELYALLISPIHEFLRRSRSVVVLPDAFLWALPFEALQNDRGRYLVQDLSVAYAPSLTALAAMRAGPVGARHPEPATGAVAPRPSFVAATDPVIDAPALERLASVRPSAGAPLLPGGREVRGAALVFAPQAAQVLARDHARTDRLTTAVRPGSAVHLAVPGCLLDTSPLYSLIALSPSTKDDPG
jgi:tetratricopeptide (TPR) repeat protein